MPVKPIGDEGRRDAEGNIILNECCMVPTATIQDQYRNIVKGKLHHLVHHQAVRLVL